jgi:hypothetical protein
MTPLALLLMAQAVAQAPSPPQQKFQLVCRDGEQQTGSHIRTGRQCKTSEEWEHDAERRVNVSPSLRVTAGQPDALTKQRAQ